VAKIPVRVQKIIDRYLIALRENNIPINQAILFGSYAQGKHWKWSDIDIALVSSIFEGDRFLDRKKIRNINLSVSSDLEVLPFRPQDFTTDDPFVKEILDTGVTLI
jgi:predicted nucleotidyltransferase